MKVRDAARTELDWTTRWKLRAIADPRLARGLAALLGQLPMKTVPKERHPLEPSPPTGRIPRIVWSTWRDTRFGRSHARAIEHFRARNPDHEFRIVSHEERDQFVSEHFADHPIREVFDAARFQPMKADIWRYLVLLKYGGWYFDIKSCLRVPLSSIAVPGVEAVVSFEKAQDKRLVAEHSHPEVLNPGHTLLNWGFAARPDHPLLRHAIEAIVARAPEYRGKVVKNPKGAIIDLSGPRMFARALDATAREVGLGDVAQYGFEFEDVGVYEMRYAWVRFLTAASYAQARNEPIIDAVGPPRW